MNNFTQVQLNIQDAITASYLVTGSYHITASHAVSASNTTAIKAGILQGSSFGGNPKTASIQFTTAWASNYSVVVTGEVPRIYTATSKSVDGFIINSNDTSSLSGIVNWQAIEVGEFSNKKIPTEGLLAWHMADALALSDGTAVGTWEDLSGNGNNLTQSAGASQPLFKLNRINGMPGLMFDGSDDKMDWPTGLLTSLDNAGECEMFIIAMKDQQTDSSGLYNLGGSDGDYCLHCYSNGGIIEVFADSATDASTPYPPVGLLTSSFCWNVYTDGVNKTIEISGSAIISGSAGRNRFYSPLTSYVFTTTYRSLGYGGRGNFTNAYASCSICEVLIYDRQLSISERSLVKNYLNSKYNVP